MRTSVADYPSVFYTESGEAVELVALLAICTYATRAQVDYATTGNVGFLRAFGFFRSI